MPHRPILRYPDPRLRMACQPVTTFDDELATLATDLIDTLREAGALGITAAHLGDLRQVVVIQLGEPDTARVYVNPAVVTSSAEQARHEEGSVSMPGVTEQLERPARVTIRYQDLQGRWQEEAAEGLLAVCHLHEIDQLAGVFWIDRLSRLKRERLLARWQKRRPD